MLLDFNNFEYPIGGQLGAVEELSEAVLFQLNLVPFIVTIRILVQDFGLEYLHVIEMILKVVLLGVRFAELMDLAELIGLLKLLLLAFTPPAAEKRAPTSSLLEPTSNHPKGTLSSF
mmetsp:Transcript_11648/g.17683  ORF Transcript_11648/g.17683 Transcript_11648/m.17683 type:complete len:117 (-) Transcript_11648:832-1182(-)